MSRSSDATPRRAADAAAGADLLAAWRAQPTGVGGFRMVGIDGVNRVNGPAPRPGWFPAQCVRCHGWTRWERAGSGRSMSCHLACGACGRTLARHAAGPDDPAAAPAANPVVTRRQKAALEWLAGQPPSPASEQLRLAI